MVTSQWKRTPPERLRAITTSEPARRLGYNEVGGGAVLEVVVGVALTALLGGLLVPAVKGRLDRNAEQYRAAVELLDTLATSLWTYWKLAIRVAYYGRQGEPGSAEFL